MNSEAFVRHRGPITSTAWIPGTRQILTSGYDSAVACFDMERNTGELWGYHQHLCNRIVVDAEGRRAASVSSDYDIYIWDIVERTMSMVLVGHSDDVEDFYFIDAERGVSVSRDRRILLWDLRSGRIRRAIYGHDKDVLSVACHDGRIYTSSDDTTLRVWDMETGRPLHVFGPFDTESDTCAIDPSRNRVVLGCDDGCVRIFDVTAGDMIAKIQAHDAGIKKVACSPIDGAILSAAYDGKIHVWDGASHERRLSLEQRKNKWERSFTWSPEGRFVVAGTFDGTVLIWDAKDGHAVAELGVQVDRPGNDCFNDVAVTEDRTVMLVSDEGCVHVGRLDGDDQCQWVGKVTPTSGRMLMNAVMYDAQSRTVATGAHDQRLHIFDWNPEGRDGLHNEVEAFLGEGPINCVRMTQQPGYEGVMFAACYTGAIVSASRDGTVRDRFRLHDNAVKSLSLHPTQPIGVSGSADGILVAWSFDGTLLRRIPGHTAIIDDVDLDPTGTFVASTGRDFLLNVYRLDDGGLVSTVELGRRSPKALCFLDAQTVIVTSYWGELLRVSLPDGQILRRTIAENGISSICRADPAGDRVVVCSYDGAVYLVRSSDLAVERELRAMNQRVCPALLA
ncbi:MAG: WD40 repeat domain-containing protein [Myxococcota bacterium]